MHFFRVGLDVGQVEVHDDRLLAAAHENARQRLVVAGVDLLVRDERRHVDEVAGAGFGGEFEPVFAFGWITTVPAQSFSAPVRAWVMAAARFMPGVCGVLTSSSLACTTRTPCRRHLDSSDCFISTPLQFAIAPDAADQRARVQVAFTGTLLPQAPLAEIALSAQLPLMFPTSAWPFTV